MSNVTALQFSLKKYPFKYYKPHISLAWNKNVRAAFKCIHCLNKAKVAYLICTHVGGHFIFKI